MIGKLINSIMMQTITSPRAQIDIVGSITFPGGIPQGVQDLADKIGNVLTVIYSVSGVFAIGYMIYGGYKIIMSTGDPQKMKEGQDTLTNALIGMAVILTSGLILNFIGNLLGVGSLITVLDIPIL